ncbi:HIT-like domain-containing protein [Dichotomopilus funicola]|uniref:HIT-like domain-containing protein n=1 Tax=Dichotomopilus funicola TaxID=1934379 RepID=A0AAN6V6U6_9PEZI|nr:HIT-like domain-containing protein [Dichotomopilus funicola]
MAPKTSITVPSPTDFDPGLPRSTSSTSPDSEPSCPFCHISAVFPPYNPSDPPSPTSPILNPELTSPQPSTFIILSTPHLVAFLDIMPLSVGHVLLCPRPHRPKLTDVSAAESAELGRYLRILSAAVVRATGIHDWNVVQNNGAAAAQVVPHMHFHVIPRPELRDQRSERFTATMFGRGQRDELDEEEGVALAERVRRAVAEVLRADEEAGAKL